MAQALSTLKLLPSYSLNSHSSDDCRGDCHAPWYTRGSAFLTIRALVFAGILAIAFPSFAQHGGGGGGGHGGGGGFGGGSHSGGRGGGSHSGSGGGAAYRGSAFRGSNGVRSVGRLESASYAGGRRETGLGGALRRFFGGSRGSTNSAWLHDSSMAPIYRSAAQASIPAAFSQVRLGANNSRLPDRTLYANLTQARPPVSEPPRFWPHQPRYPCPIQFSMAVSMADTAAFIQDLDLVFRSS